MTAEPRRAARGDRYFPDSTALALAVLTQDLEDIADRTEAWVGEPDVFLWFLDEIADLCVRAASLSKALRAVAPETVAPLQRMIAEAGKGPLRDAQAAGLVRADLSADEIPMIAKLLGAGLNGDLAERQAVSRRTREIVFSGLRAHA
jgi:AcrR family transcriptional regulator